MEKEPSTCSFTVQIDVAVEEEVFQAPSFRFAFLDGSKVQTPTISTAGWTPLASLEATTNDTSSQSPRCTSYRYEHEFAAMAITESVARAIDREPVLAFILSDQVTSGTARGKTSELKAATTNMNTNTNTITTSTSAAAVAAAGRGRLIADIFELDVSVLLSGALHTEQSWSHDDNHKDQLLLTGHAPDHQPLSVFAKAKTKQDLNATVARTLFTAASGIRQLTLRVRTSAPLLSPSLRLALNPLTVSLGTLRHLPGLSLPRVDASTGRTVSAYSPLVQQCRPVYTILRFFPDKKLYGVDEDKPHLSSQNVPHTRIAVTTGRRHGNTVHWSYSVTILCGRCDPVELYDAIQSSALTIEVRDRDFFQDRVLEKLHEKWESLHSTGVDPTAIAVATGGGGGAASVTSAVSTIPASASTTTTPRTPGSIMASATGGSLAGHHKPLDVFAVDEIAARDWRSLLLRANELFAYGTAIFRLDELLLKAQAMDPSVVAASPSSSLTSEKPYASFKLTADVLAMTRRTCPIGSSTASSSSELTAAAEVNVAELSSTQKLLREPAAFIANGTTLSLSVQLQHPIFAPSSVIPSMQTKTNTPLALFGRLVIIFPYRDTPTLIQIMNTMEHVNTAALPGVPLRSHQMTDRERAACDDGKLDVVTGVMVLDTEFRMVILEGLADGAMRVVHERLPRPRLANDPKGYRMFANDGLRFPQRLYTCFDVDLKRIKLRYALPMLMTMPDIYMRTKVGEQCYLALTKLTEMRNASRLVEVKDMALFPTAAMLLEVESKYGESISLEDIHGKTGSSTSLTSLDVDKVVAQPEQDESGPEKPQAINARTRVRRAASCLKAPTDATNPEFEAFRRTRQEKNFLAQRQQHIDEQERTYKQQKEWLAAETRPDSSPVYMYSGQKLRTQDALQEQLRKQLANDRNCSYTYGSEFQSLALSLVNPEELRQTEEREGRQKWTTQRGFVYPAPRSTAEYYKHADAPSQARCEDLRQPFVDNANHPKPVSRDTSAAQSSGQQAFVTLPSKDMVFGGTNGDGSVNAEYFKSVHLCGEGLRREMAEALQHEKDEWTRKLVVDPKEINFLAHGNICSLPRSKPSQIDKLTDILDGTVRSKPLRIVMNATLPSGKRVPLRQNPVSIMNQQEYEGNVATTFATTLRHTDPTRFLARSTLTTTKVDASGMQSITTTEKPQDFHFPSISNVLTPPVKRATTYKGITPMHTNEKQGMLWSNQ